MFWVKLLRSIISVLHSEISPRQIAGGVALGAIIGLTPFFCLHNLFIFLLIFILRVNIGAAFLSVSIFGLIGLLTDPLAHQIGYYFLAKTDSLTPFWTYLYNLPLVPYTRFNNTIVLGSLVLSVIMFIPIYLGSIKLVGFYRARWRHKVEKWKIMKWFKLTTVYNVWDKYKG